MKIEEPSFCHTNDNIKEIPVLNTRHGLHKATQVKFMLKLKMSTLIEYLIQLYCHLSQTVKVILFNKIVVDISEILILSLSTISTRVTGQRSQLP